MSVHLDPTRVIALGEGFMASKTLLSAIELELFTHLGAGALTGEQIKEKLGLHARAVPDFPDTLVALGMLTREGEGADATYRNAPDAAAFLDKAGPTYIGGVLEMCNSRLYGYWGDLTEGLRTGSRQSEEKANGTSMYEALYSDQGQLKGFLRAMTGASKPGFLALAEKFDFSPHRTLCDVGGGSGDLSVIVAARHEHMRCTSFDLPAVEPITRQAIEAANLSDRVTTVSGDFFVDRLPEADIITMSMILHNWNQAQKMHLIQAAYDALPTGGTLIAVEPLIDDARCTDAFSLLMSLNMLIEFGDAFGFTAADFTRWCTEVGFERIDVIHLGGPMSACIACK